eukprot:TRINITY_DN39537_c0_g1_i1.p1 TRINITY_DN39537_c0_g1~~TRINITY_DN39537_c0_g1_i1.p1  ORF type:complete len:274 (+),score=106.28 TRINITY_DN39537_c0_g1_i1:61-882(+)
MADLENNMSAAEKMKMEARESLANQSFVENTKSLMNKLATNPAYRPVLLMMVFTIGAAGCLTYYEADHFFLKFGIIVIISAIGMLGQVQGTYLVYTSVQLQEQIDAFAENNEVMHKENLKFKAENKDFAASNEKLKKQCEQLHGNVDKMKANADTLREQLNGLKSLQATMGKYKDSMGADFKESMQKAKDMTEKLDRMTNENTKTLLFKVAQDLEFMDDEEGLSKKEYDAFLLRIPAEKKALFPAFEKIATGSPLAVTYDSLSDTIERVLASA